jgi:hypothetical protein
MTIIKIIKKLPIYLSIYYINLFFSLSLVDYDDEVDDKLRLKVFWYILKTIDSESNQRNKKDNGQT